MDHKDLALTSARIRRWALEAIFSARSGHIGGSLSLAEILSVLYWREMRADPVAPRDPGRDRLVLSKGHCSPGLYAALALRGYFPLEDLRGFRSLGSYLSGHVEMNKVPGIDMSAGSLGQGLSAAVGMALAAKLDKKDYRTFCILGDGEVQEGQIWEAAMSAPHLKLDNLVVIVDNNNLQISGKVDEILNPYPLDEKFAAFGFEVLHCDGHDFASIEKAFAQAKQTKGRPAMILARTVKGKGVSFMENKVGWHGSPPNKEQYEQAAAELDAVIAGLERQVG